MKNQTTMIEKLRKLALANTAAKAIFTWAAGRDKNSTATGLDRICRKVKLEKDVAVKTLQELEKIGIGTYIIGRKGGKTRFEWNFGLVTVGMAALGKSEAMEIMGSPGDDEETVEVATVPARIPASSATENRQASEARTMTNMGATLFLSVPGTVSVAKLKQIQEILAS